MPKIVQTQTRRNKYKADNEKANAKEEGVHHNDTMKKHIVFDALPFCILPLGAIGWYCADFKEKEKQHHRY